MGADLIGYHVKGPKHLDESKREAAEVKVARARELQDALVRNEHENGRDEAAFVAREEELWAQVCAEFPRMKDLEARDFAAAASTTTLVDNLFDLWKNGSRDASMRDDPDDPTQVMLFAGEPSWGDEPDGYGYVTLRDAEILGLFDRFNIR
jgi:hypothetical protein